MAITGLQLHVPLDRCWTMAVTVPSGDYTQGQMVKIEDTVCVVVTAGDEGDNVAVLTRAPMITVPCAIVTSGAYLVGAKVYFDAADAEVNESSSGNTLCGTVIEVGVVGAEEVMIALDGHLGIVA